MNTDARGFFIGHTPVAAVFLHNKDPLHYGKLKTVSRPTITRSRSGWVRRSLLITPTVR